MFFRDRHGNSYPISLIEKISERKELVEGGGNVWRHIVTLRGGDQVVIGGYDRGIIDLHVIATMPAGESDYVITFDDEDTSRIYKAKIIGWAITAGSGVVPVTVDGVNDESGGSPYVQLSDGTVTRFGEETWQSLDAFLTSRKA